MSYFLYGLLIGAAITELVIWSLGKYANKSVKKSAVEKSNLRISGDYEKVSRVIESVGTKEQLEVAINEVKAFRNLHKMNMGHCKMYAELNKQLNDKSIKLEY